MIVYIDTSVAVATVIQEERTRAIRRTFGRHRGRLYSSELFKSEVHRVMIRVGGTHAEADQLVLGVSLLRLDSAILAQAAGFDEPIKTLDAVHLATCLHLQRELGDAEEVTLWTIDRRMANVAHGMGIPLL